MLGDKKQKDNEALRQTLEFGDDGCIDFSQEVFNNTKTDRNFEVKLL